MVMIAAPPACALMNKNDSPPNIPSTGIPVASSPDFFSGKTVPSVRKLKNVLQSAFELEKVSQPYALCM